MDVNATLLSLAINNNVLLNVILELLIDVKSKVDNQSITEVESIVEELMSHHHESASKLIVPLKD